MPNWKTYESSVRLLSAILAAHPDLKLNYSAIAEKYEQGVTAKAVSTRFERLKKEPDWLGNSANGDAPHSAAPKAPRTPKKKVAKKAVSDDENEDDEEAEISPSKFTPKASLNKTMGGRIAKARTPRKAVGATPSYVESGGEEDEEDEEISDEYVEEKISSIVVKSESNEFGAPNFAASENAGNSFSHSFSNGHSNVYSNGQAGGYDMDDEDEFHEARRSQFGNGFDDDDAV